MSNTLLLIDAPYLCHRAFYSTGHLGDGEGDKGTLFGFFRTIQTLVSQHTPDKIAFCFDHGIPKRREIFPGYKMGRRKREAALSEQEKKDLLQFRHQVHLLKTEILTQVGYLNVFYQDGYEADDHIAMLAHSRGDDYTVIVSGDHDLYQLLGNSCVIWNTQRKRTYTKASLNNEFKILPKQWATVKAIAGCATDNIPGVKGVGEILAAKYLKGTLAPGGKTYMSIIKQAPEWRKNIPLVLLPFEGTKRFAWHEDVVSEKKWDKVMKRLGFDSLVGGLPGHTRTIPSRRK